MCTRDDLETRHGSERKLNAELGARPADGKARLGADRFFAATINACVVGSRVGDEDQNAGADGHARIVLGEFT